MRRIRTALLVVAGCMTAVLSTTLLGQGGGGAVSVAPGTPPPGQPYFTFMVTKPASEAPTTGRPVYPPELKSRDISGTVQAQFVVDTMGRVEEASFKVLTASHGSFADAVREALPRMRFTPAEVRGAKVRQLVQQPFVFAIPGEPAPTLPVSAERQLGDRMAGGTPAPAPPAGKVNGWSLTMRTTIDSGGGRSPSVTTTRYMGMGSKVRMEFESSRMRSGSMANILDTTLKTSTVIMSSMRSAMVMRRPSLPSGGQMPTRTYERISGRTDTVRGSERILGMMPTQVRDAAVGRVTETFIGLTCSAVVRTDSETWIVQDSTIGAIQRLMARSISGALSGPADEAPSDPSTRPRPGQSIVRTVSRGLIGSNVTLTMDVIDFRLGEVDASLFAIPEGFAVQDMTGMQLPTPPASENVPEVLFRQRYDSTRVGPDGSRATCRPA